MTFLITGATGLLGNNIARLLLERGESVRVLVRATSDPRPLEGLNVDCRQGEVGDAAAVEAACHGASCVIHSAARVHMGWTDLKLQREVNVDGTRNVAAAALACGAKMVHVSSVDAIGGAASPQDVADEDSPKTDKPPCTYVVTKREADQIVQEHVDRGLDAVIVHPTYMFGPWDWKPSSGRMLLEVAKRFTPICPPGGVSVVDVRDVAQGILAACQAPAGRHYILSGENMTFYQLWHLLADVSGSRGPLKSMSRPLKAAVGRLGDLWTAVSGREGDINSAALAMASQWGYYSSARAQAELGYHARPARQAVEAAWQWFRDNGYARA